MKLFRNTRKKSLSTNQVGKYLKYAIGEIALVVIGILVAVSINNWNEERKQAKTLENILATVATDIVRDTVLLENVIDHYQSRENAFLQVINDSLSREEIINCKVCPFLVQSFRVFTPNLKGYDLLREFADFNETPEDTLVANIIFVYSGYQTDLEIFSNLITDNITGNLAYWRDHYPWYASLLMGNYEESYYDYVTSQSDYKNRVAHQYILVYRNYVPILQNFNKQIKKLLTQVRQRTNE
ncbi:MAG: DUF6090 family protein [Bacteroidota bacterium]